MKCYLFSFVFNHFLNFLHLKSPFHQINMYALSYHGIFRKSTPAKLFIFLQQDTTPVSRRFIATRWWKHSLVETEDTPANEESLELHHRITPLSYVTTNGNNLSLSMNLVNRAYEEGRNGWWINNSGKINYN